MIIIYTDGSAKGNGRKNCVGGYGVVVCEGNPQQEPESYKVVAAYADRIVGTTNNRMEMSAILWAIQNYGTDGFFSPIVYTDSLYCINSFTRWINAWKANDWTRQGKELENKDLIQEYDRLTTVEGLRVELKYVHGHQGNLWNEVADQLATGKITPEAVMKRYGG